MEFGKQKTEKNLMGAYVPIGTDTKGEQLKMTVPSYVKQASHDESKSSSSYSSNASSSDIRAELDRPMKVASSAVGDFGVKRSESTQSMTPKDSVELLRKYRESVSSQETAIKTKEEPIIRIDDTPEYKFIGEAFDCYIMIEYEDALLVIDKHAAHERVIFEDLKKQGNEDKRIATQILMLPITVILNAEELACAVEYVDEINQVGFEYKVNGTAADITAIPSAVSSDEAESLFIRMLDEIIEGRGKPSITEAVRKEKALYQIACKAAIKGGRVYTKEIIHWLIKKLLALPDITVCPHGRPVAFKLTKNELDRQFERLK